MQTKSKLYLVCPACGDDDMCVQHYVDDALAGKWPDRESLTFGPWPCHNRDCDRALQGRVTRDGRVIDLEAVPKGHTSGYALLKLGDLYLVVDEMQGDDLDEGRDYYYHSHSCPVNFLRRVEEVFDVRGRDPHGRLRYVASIPGTPENRKAIADDNGNGTVGSLEGLFALFKTDGQPAPTDWPEDEGGVLPFIVEARREYEKERSPKA